MIKNNKKIIFLFLFQILSVIGWFIIFRLYPLTKYIHVPFFALDKISGHFNSLSIRYTALLILLITFCYLIGCFLINNVKTKLFYWIIILLVLLQAIIVLFIYPVGNTDVFNYVAESKLFYFYRQNPYTTTYSLIPYDQLKNFSGFLDKTLAYGPVWLFSTAIPDFFIDFNNSNFLLTSIFSYKTFNLILTLLTGFLVTKLFNKNNDKLKAWYFWVANPFVLFDVVVNVHNDVLIALFFVLFLFLYKKKKLSAFLFIVLASLVKIYCLALFPFVIIKAIKDKWKITTLLKSTIISISIFIAFYLPFFVRGLNISQLIKGISGSQQIQTYSVFSLTREYLTTNFFGLTYIRNIWLFFLLLFLLISFFVVFKFNRNINWIIFFIFNFFIIFLSLSHPWYFIPALVILISSSLEKKNTIMIFIISFSLLIFYPMSIWAWFNSGFKVFSVHLFQSFFIVMPVFFVLIQNFISFHNNEKE